MLYNNYYKQRGSAALAAILVVLILVAVAVVYFIIRQPRGVNEVETVSSSAPSVQPTPVPPVSSQDDNNPSVATGGAVEVGGENGVQAEPAQQSEVKVFNITGRNFSFSQQEIRVKQGDRVKIVFTSVDGFHDWRLDEFNASTNRVNTGGTTEAEFVADKKGSFEYYCSVGQHRALGMVGKLIVE